MLQTLLDHRESSYLQVSLVVCIAEANQHLYACRHTVLFVCLYYTHHTS